MDDKKCEELLEEEETTCSPQDAEEIVEEPAMDEMLVEDKPAPKEGKAKAIIAIALAVCLVLGIGAYFAAPSLFGKDEGSDSITLEMTDKDGVFLPHNFTVANEDLTEKMAAQVVASCDDNELTNQQLAFYYWQAYVNFFNQYGEYATYFVDLSKPLSDQMFGETQTMQDMLLQSAMETYRNEAALYGASQADGFVLPEDMQTYVNGMADDMESFAQMYGYASAQEYVEKFYGGYTTVEGYLDFATRSFTAQAYLAEKTADFDATEEEAYAYFDANTDVFVDTYQMDREEEPCLVDVRHILVTPTADEGAAVDESGAPVFTEENWAAALAEAEDIWAQWETGEATEDSFAELAKTYSVDPGSNSNGGLYQDVAQGQMVDTFDAWCFDQDRQYGDVDIVKTSYGYHVMFYVRTVNSWMSYAENMVVSEKVAAYQTELVEQTDFSVNYDEAVLPPSEMEALIAAQFSAAPAPAPAE